MNDVCDDHFVSNLQVVSCNEIRHKIKARWNGMTKYKISGDGEILQVAMRLAYEQEGMSLIL